MRPLNIAVIGSGISGLSAAWLLDKQHNVTLFEADHRLGGHTNTISVKTKQGTVPVDTGFICFNSSSYPNLVAFFEHLNVPVYETNMSFAASMKSGSYEYSGGTYFGLFGQPKNLFKPDHWRMIKDILRFFKEAPQALDTLDDSETLISFLHRNSYSTAFTHLHLLPMAAAIWSSKLEDMLNYPAKAFIRFFKNHGLLQIENRPKWGTVSGGAKIYIDKIVAQSSFTIKTDTPINKVHRKTDGVIVHTNESALEYDQVVIATHADQALSLLDNPSLHEEKLLGAFGYAKNSAVLHRDRRLMPKRKLTWASWNYIDFAAPNSTELTDNSDLCLTYWMNSLQKLQTKEDIFVTLNPPNEMEINNIVAQSDYMHPIFDAAAMSAQRDLWSLQGVNNTWYCGAHFGAGFHEDGIQSGLAVAEQLGGMSRPWNVADASGRIYIHTNKELKEAAE